MAASQMVAGPISAFAYGIETTSGTQVAPTNFLFIESGSFTDKPEVIQFATMRGTPDTVFNTRPSIHKVNGKVTAYLSPFSCGPLVRSMVGNDTIYPTTGATATTFASAATATAATISSVASIAALSFIAIGTPGSTTFETNKVTAVTGTGPYTLTLATPLINAHASAEPIATAQGGISSAATAGAQTVIVTALPALPAGVAEYTGTYIWLDTELKMILAISGAGPYTLTVTPLASAKTVNQAAYVPQMHVIQPYTGSSITNLATLSTYMQFGRNFEWQIPYTWPSKFGIKADQKDVRLDADFECQALPIDVTGSSQALFQATGTYHLTNFSATENSDAPFTLFDGGLIANFSPGDAAPSIHSRVVSLDYSFDNKLIGKVPSGGVAKTQIYARGERMQSLKFKEEAFSNSQDADMYLGYVQSQTDLPAYLSLVNANTGYAFGIWMPRTKVLSYNPVFAMNDVIGFDGELLPILDSTSGKALKICIVNPSVTGY